MILHSKFAIHDYKSSDTAIKKGTEYIFCVTATVICIKGHSCHISEIIMFSMLLLLTVRYQKSQGGVTSRSKLSMAHFIKTCLSKNYCGLGNGSEYKDIMTQHACLYNNNNNNNSILYYL
jgi:hypothetical protein